MKQTAFSFLATRRPRPTRLEVARFEEGLDALNVQGSVVSGAATYECGDLARLFLRVRNDRAALKQWIAANHPDRNGGKVHPHMKQAMEQFSKLKKRDAQDRENYRVNHGLDRPRQA